MNKIINRVLYSPFPLVITWAAVLGLLTWMMQWNYLLFHVIAELFSIVIAFTIFIITWNARAQIKNTTLLVLGISFLFTGAIDLIHTLSYSGMDLIPGTMEGDPNAANLATQLWLAARFLQSASIAAAPFFYARRVRSAWIGAAYITITALLLLSIFVWRNFPASYIDGTGLTDFKRASEYVIVLGIVIGMGGLYRVRSGFTTPVVRSLQMAFGFTVLSEIMFTEYLAVAGTVNGLGHILKIIAFYFVYKAFVEVGLRRPQDLLFRELAQREKALEESERRERARAAQIEAILDAAPAIVWIAHDKDARVITGNRASYEVLRMNHNTNPSKTAPEDVAPAHFRVLTVTGRELAPEELPVQVSAATGLPVRDFEEILEFDDGDQVRLIGNVTPLLDEDGQPAGAVGAFIDITSRAQAEKALLESESRFRGLFESMTEAFALLWLEEESILDDGSYGLMVVALNPAFEQLTGIPRDDIIGNTYRQTLSDDPGSWEHRVLSVARTGQPEYLKDFHIAGKRFEVVVYKAGENQVAMLGIDVTERYRSQTALELSEARLRRLVDANIIGIIYFDESGRVSQANDAFLSMVGYSRADFDSGLIDWASMMPPEYREFDRQRMDEAIARGACTPYEKEYIRKDGSRVPVLVGWAYFSGDQDAPFIGFVHDMTMQKQADEASLEYAARLERINVELARANGELQDFAFMASHDLQEPLRKIQAFGERLAAREGENLQVESVDYLNRMLSAAKRMRSMINDLLSLSRVVTRAKPFVQVNLNEVVEGVLGDLELLIERNQGQVEVSDLPAVEADPTQMHQLFLNLIGNGLKFHKPETPPLVKVYADCTEDDKSVILYVQDNGIGFDEQFIERIFQPFQRLHGRTEYEGSGIGLAVCRKIVERHFGSITARSAEDNGATFIITLPKQQQREPEKPARVSKGGAKNNGGES